MSLESSLRAVSFPPPAGSQEVRSTAQSSSEPRSGKCDVDPGVYFPIVNRNRCEGKRDCVEVCPYDVFEVRPMDDREFSALSFAGKLKSRMHGKLSAYAPRAAACRACGLCVAACPEKAITLVSAQDWLGRDIV